MNVEQEEKLLKTLDIATLLVFVPLNAFIIKNDLIRLVFLAPLLFLLTVLHVRKYKRDKKANVDVSRYKMMLLFMGISVLLFLFFLFYPIA